jgi:trehalose/maltose hydrolase-like predicted phosphorylase
MGGTLDLVTKAFAGISLFKDAILFEPQLPLHWKRLSFKLLHRRNQFSITITPDQLTVKKLAESKKQPVDILVGEKRYPTKGKETVTIELPRD